MERNKDNILIILAAGEGKRLRPYSENIPKCMVPLKGIPLIERNIEQWKKAGYFACRIVSGYKERCLDTLGYKLITNPEYNSSNMVWSLLMALSEIENADHDYIYVSYGDIVLSSKNVEILLGSHSDMNVVVDRDWETLWSLRMDDYMGDVESLKIFEDRIVEIGKKPRSKDDIQGQYVGVLKVRRDLLIEQLKSYLRWVENGEHQDIVASRKNIYLTDFIQTNIDQGVHVNPVLIDGGWLELDSVSDLTAYEESWGQVTIFSDLV